MSGKICMKQMPTFSSIIYILTLQVVLLSPYHRINNTLAQKLARNTNYLLTNMGPGFQGPALCIMSQPFQAQQAFLGSQHAGKYFSLNAAGKDILVRDRSFPSLPSGQCSPSSSPPFPSASLLSPDPWNEGCLSCLRTHCLYPTLELHFIFKQQMELVSYSHH